jgi:glucose/arabinose dehydrogenase
MADRAHRLRSLSTWWPALVGMALWGAADSAASAPGVPTGFIVTPLVTGLSNPTAMEFSPDGRLFISEQGGR